MSAEFYVKRAESELAPLRRRLPSLGSAFDPDIAVDIADIASVACDCEVVFTPQLSESRMFSILRSEYGVALNNPSLTANASLAGALCVAENGLFKWIFVREEDSVERKRFTVAHELGHLFLEALPEIENVGAMLEPHAALRSKESDIRIFSRCINTDSPSDTTRRSRPPLTALDIRELHAHHFAAELLMPYEGIKRLINRKFGKNGIRTVAERDQLVRCVADQYSVSAAAASRRIDKDLGVVPSESDPNHDLFV